MSQVKAEIRKLKDFIPARINPNAGNEHSVPMIVDSIQINGAGRPMLADKDGEMIAGSHSLQAFIDAGFEDAIVITGDGKRPIIYIREDIDIEDPRGRSLQVGDNRIGQKSFTPDTSLLGAILADIAEQDAALVKAAGYNEGELAALLDSMREPAGDPGAAIDRAEELLAKWQVERGQLWRIGEHRLLCGDSTNADDVARLMQDEKALLMVTDPPYGVEYDPEWRNEAAAQGLIAFASRREGKVTNDDRDDWREAYCLFDGDIIYCWHAGLRASNVQDSLESVGFDVRSQIIWNKPRFVISRGHYHWQHEPCWYAVRKGRQAHWIGDHSQTTVWNIPLLDSDDQKSHGTQKPVECMARPIRNHDAPIVYDPFLGSGTTLVACEQLGRKGRGLEIEPKYCAVILERMAGMGLTPELVSD